MSSSKGKMHHPGCAACESAQKLIKRPMLTGGIILLAVGAVSLYMMFPEIRRYARIERM